MPLAMTKHLFNARACVLPCAVSCNGWQLVYVNGRLLLNGYIVC